MNSIIRKALPLWLSIMILSGCNNAKVSESERGDTIYYPEAGTYEEATTYSEKNNNEREDDSIYRGKFIMEYENVMVYANYGLEEEYYKYGDDIGAKDETYLVRYVDSIPRDTMILKGPYNSLLGKNKFCQITVGTDTVNVNILRPFGKVLDIRFINALTGCRFYRYSNHYPVGIEPYRTDFQINIAMRDDDPEYIRNFINEMVSDDMANCFAYNSGGSTIFPHIPLFNFEKGDISQMARYYFNHFGRLYKEENTDEENPDVLLPGSYYSYQLYVYPVWEDKEANLVTWMFYIFSYLGGAHGGQQEYFLTFDNETGRILGKDNFYTNTEYKKAIGILKAQLNRYRGAKDPSEYRISAALDLYSDEPPKTTTLYEAVGGKLYPRPALTRQGMVFTYQTYEKGAYCEGVLHFTQPYNLPHHHK